MDITNFQKKCMINELTYWIFERIELFDNDRLREDIVDFSDIQLRKLSDNEIVKLYATHIGDPNNITPHPEHNIESRFDMRDYVNKVCGFMFVLLLFICSSVNAGQIDDETAIRCIVGEASNQGEIGMYALASGLYNRGTTKGVYGCNAKHIDNEPDYVFKQAREAWEKAKVKRLHNGTMWENIDEFGKPWWAEKMNEVYRYGDHVFYEE